MLFYALISLVIIFYFNYETARLKKDSFLGLLFAKNKSYLFIILLGSYAQALIHEVPNMFAKQWVYQDFPFMQIHILGLPVIAFLGWIILTAIPVSVYYFIISRDKSKPQKIKRTTTILKHHT